MKGAIETMIGIIVMTMVALLGASYIIASLNTQNAQQYHSAIIQELEASNYSPDTKIALIKTAEENGYNFLEINMLSAADGKHYAEVVLDYNYSIPLLNQVMEHKIIGYAR